MPIEIQVIGSAEPFSTVAIRSQITGQLIAVNFREGDIVRKEQVLFELDKRPLVAALEQAQANLQRDMAQAANAEVQATRLQQLVDRGIAPRDQGDTAKTSVVAMNATVEADRAAVENAKIQIQYATIPSPLTGRTGALMVHQGNLVRANDQTPLVVINEVAPISVAFSIPEARLTELRRYMSGGSLTVTATPQGSDRSSTGRIAFIDNAVDQNTGTIRIKGTFPNEDGRHADDGSESDRCSVGGRAGGAAGDLRLRRESGPDGGGAASHRGAHARRRERDRHRCRSG
jgi:multidrug efflux system membrane fusion protein